jgi:Lrp/AsnC family transcriptional regulator for asnA, asnC and gidA
MVGINVQGDLEDVAKQLSEIDRSDYVVITSGRYDLLLELTCENNDHLLAILNDQIRTIPGVIHAEAHIYLDLHKQTYAWGTR